ncbi:MAG: hypothetical protein ACR2L0_03795 [Gaiellaceae bacterium]
MAGELVDIGKRPLLVAAFEPPGAAIRFNAWREAHADVLAAVPEAALRVEYGRTGQGLFVRVRIDEEHVPDDLRPPPAAA